MSYSSVQSNRRRARRVQPGPLPVSMHTQDGVLVDISESGACIRMIAAPPPEESLAFVLRWRSESILLRGRVVRSFDHHIGIEFLSLPPYSVEQLQRLTQSVN